MVRWQSPAQSLFMDLAEQVVHRLPHHHHDPRSGHPLAKPGAWLARQPESVRAKLHDLRSADIADVRVKPWWQ